MRLENLKEFVVYSRELNISRAARKLNLAQSTLSRHLIEMERDLGFEVIDRDNDRGLTLAGMKFLSYAEQMLFLYETGVETCRAEIRKPKEMLVVQEYGGHPDVSAHLSSLTSMFSSRHEEMVFEWKRYCGYDLAGALLAGELDVAQTVLHESTFDQSLEELDQRGVDALILHEEGIVYWTKKGGPLVERGEATLKELSDFMLAMPLGKVYNPMRNAMSDLFKSRGLMPCFDYSKTWSVSDIPLTGQDLVACVLPPAAKQDPSLCAREDMAFVDVTDATSGFLTCLLFRKNERKNHVKAFRAFAEEVLAQ